MGHRSAEVVMPIGAVDTEASIGWDIVVGEEHGEWDVGEVVIGVEGWVAAFHAGVAEFGPDFENAGGGASPFAARDEEVVDFRTVFDRVESLSGKVDLDMFLRGVA